MQVQTGRDLRRSTRSSAPAAGCHGPTPFSPADWLADHAIDARGRRVLLPRDFDYYRDEDYLFPLLANLARAHAARCSARRIAALKTG
jgi:hypothetical protein